MLDGFATLLENIAAAVDAFNQRVQKRFAESRAACWAWITTTTRRCVAYLLRLGKDLAALIFAFGKLLLFYLPGVILWLLRWYTPALCWFILITAAGLISRRRERRNLDTVAL